MLWRIRSLRRIWYALPFAAAVIVGLGSLFSIFYEQEFGLNSAQRGFAAAMTEPAQILGLVVGIPIANRLLRRIRRWCCGSSPWSGWWWRPASPPCR